MKSFWPARVRGLVAGACILVASSARVANAEPAAAEPAQHVAKFALVVNESTAVLDVCGGAPALQKVVEERLERSVFSDESTADVALVQCCGSNERGRLGKPGADALAASFTKAAGVTSYVVQVATSDRAVCALVRDGSVECWGSNEKGELGRGRGRDAAEHPTAVKVAF